MSIERPNHIPQPNDYNTKPPFPSLRGQCHWPWGGVPLVEGVGGRLAGARHITHHDWVIRAHLLQADCQQLVLLCWPGQGVYWPGCLGNCVKGRGKREGVSLVHYFIHEWWEGERKAILDHYFFSSQFRLHFTFVTKIFKIMLSNLWFSILM